MGIWGLQPWENDAAANWFDETLAQTRLTERVEETLKLRIDEHADEIRAAAHIVIVLAEHYIWPQTSRLRCIELAASQLQQLIDRRVVVNPDMVRVVEAEIELLRARV